MSNIVYINQYRRESKDQCDYVPTVCLSQLSLPSYTEKQVINCDEALDMADRLFDMAEQAMNLSMQINDLASEFVRIGKDYE